MTSGRCEEMIQTESAIFEEDDESVLVERHDMNLTLNGDNGTELVVQWLVLGVSSQFKLVIKEGIAGHDDEVFEPKKSTTDFEVPFLTLIPEEFPFPVRVIVKSETSLASDGDGLTSPVDSTESDRPVEGEIRCWHLDHNPLMIPYLDR